MYGMRVCTYIQEQGVDLPVTTQNKFSCQGRRLFCVSIYLFEMQRETEFQFSAQCLQWTRAESGHRQEQGAPPGSFMWVARIQSHELSPPAACYAIDK